MKKSILFTLILTLLIGFASCSGDDDESRKPKPFEWEGDIEGYNPLLGTWRHNKKPSLLLRFSEEKEYYIIEYDKPVKGEVLTIKDGPFEINKTAYKYGYNIIRYKIVDDDTFIQYPNKNNDDNPSYLTRVKGN